MLHHQPYNELEILKWISERNQHISISDLAFMINIPNDSSYADEDIDVHTLEDFDFVN